MGFSSAFLPLRGPKLQFVFFQAQLDSLSAQFLCLSVAVFCCLLYSVVWFADESVSTLGRKAAQAAGLTSLCFSSLWYLGPSILSALLALNSSFGLLTPAKLTKAPLTPLFNNCLLLIFLTSPSPVLII